MTFFSGYFYSIHHRYAFYDASLLLTRYAIATKCYSSMVVSFPSAHVMSFWCDSLFISYKSNFLVYGGFSGVNEKKKKKKISYPNAMRSKLKWNAWYLLEMYVSFASKERRKCERKKINQNLSPNWQIE